MRVKGVTYPHKSWSGHLDGIKQLASRYYNNYFSRGVSKLTLIITMIVSVLTFIKVYFGVGDIFVIIIAVIAALVGFGAYGLIDYSAVGTKVAESYENIITDYGIYFWLALFKQLKKISDKLGVEEDEEFKRLRQLLEKQDRKYKFNKYIKE